MVEEGGCTLMRWGGGGAGGEDRLMVEEGGGTLLRWGGEGRR